MKRTLFTIISLGILALTPFAARSSDHHRALWLQFEDGNGKRTSIAATVEVARAVMEADKEKVHFTCGKKKDLITRQMLEDVLDGTTDVVEVRDPDDGTYAKIYLAPLDVPSRNGTGSHIVLESYKNGKREMRMSLGDFSVEGGDDESEGSFDLKWEHMLPFLSKSGGAIFINGDDGSEVWLYTER